MKLKRNSKKFNKYNDRNKEYYDGFLVYFYLNGERIDWGILDNVPEMDSHRLFYINDYEHRAKLYDVEYFDTHRSNINLYYHTVY